MKNDTAAILVGIEKLETSLENIGGGSSVNPESLVSVIQTEVKPALEAIQVAVNESRASQTKLDESLQKGFSTLRDNVEKGVVNVTGMVDTRIGQFEAKMVESQKLIQDQVLRVVS